MNSVDLVAVAKVLLRVLAGSALREADYQLAADYFYADWQGERVKSFRSLAEVVVNQLPENPAMRHLLQSNRWALDDRRNSRCDTAWAEGFIAAYVDALDAQTLLSQPIVVGYAPRQAGNSFDVVVEENGDFPGWMLLYTVTGTGEFDTGLRRLTMNSGHLVLIEPNAVFSYYRSAGDALWGHYWVTFQPESDWMAWLQWPRIGPHLGHVVASGPQAAAIEQAFADLTTNFSAELALRDELASNLLAQIILRAQQINPDSQHRPIEQRVRKAQLYIEEHFAESFSVHDVAGHVGVSPSHLSSLFKQHTGMTLLAWRDEKRMMAAARDLLTTNRAVSEVAAACGFDDGPFFSRCFRKHFGCSPRDYRSRGGKPG